jgi:Na+/melibiose symporter-like transporter
MGLIMSVGAAGGLLGAVAAPWLAARIGEGTVIPVCALNSVFLLLVPLAAVVFEPAASLALLLVSELGFGFRVLVYNIVQLTMRQVQADVGQEDGTLDDGALEERERA